MPPTTPRQPAWATAKRPVGDTAMTGVQSAKHSMAATSGAVTTRGIGGGLRTLLGRHDAGGIARVDADDFRAVHLVGHDDRNAFAVERLHGKATVFHDMIEVVLHVGTKVQRGERPLACSPIATGEGDADVARLEQRIIGEHGNATRAAGARVECRCR